MDRPRALKELKKQFGVHRAVTLIGPRQCGKTTLAREYARGLPARMPVTFFDLERAVDLQRLADPELALKELSGLVVIDEVQRRPELFPSLRYLIDYGPKSRKFLLLGSASGDLLRQTSESLAGRTGLMELTPFSFEETGELDKLWWRGGFPPAWLARTDEAAFKWLESYVSTFLERDIPSFGLRVPATALRRFWMMLAHVNGQTLNYAELARAFGATNKTVAHYTDILASTFMVRLLQPWFENISKRQVRAPKLYFRDTGVLHSLLSIPSRAALQAHPAIGASWEGFALETVIRSLSLVASDCFFWGTHGEAELDLLAFRKGQRVGFEFKRTLAPKVTPSMRIALEDLKLKHLYVVTPGDETFALTRDITALGLEKIGSLA